MPTASSGRRSSGKRQAERCVFACTTSHNAPISCLAFARTGIRYDASRGWFSCDRTCAAHKAKYEIAQGKWDALKATEAAITKQAKSEVGIFSEYGVQETRDVFWSTFAGGKDFAKRQSMWDLLFAGLRMRKDEDMAAAALR